MDKVAKRLVIYRLTDIDAIQAQGLSISSSIAIVDFDSIDLPEHLMGFILPVHGTHSKKLEHIQAAPEFIQLVRRNIANLAIQRPRRLGAQRAFFIAFGGRRRPRDFVYCLETFIKQHNCKVRPIVCVVDLIRGQEHEVARSAAVAWRNSTAAGIVIATFAYTLFAKPLRSPDAML